MEVNFLRKMSRKKLNAYISNLECVIAKEDNEQNKKLFKKWLYDANQEVIFRDTRKLKFLKENHII